MARSRERPRPTGEATVLLVVTCTVILTGLLIDVRVLTMIGALLTLGVIGAVSVAWVLADRLGHR